MISFRNEKDLKVKIISSNNNNVLKEHIEKLASECDYFVDLQFSTCVKYNNEIIYSVIILYK